MRPKDISILEDESYADITMKGEITFIEMLGDDSIIEVKMGSSLIKVTNADSNLDVTVGRIIKLGIPYSKVHFFDINGGREFYHSHQKIP
jgi:multiple sugar transport system ATP-binding protein